MPRQPANPLRRLLQSPATPMAVGLAFLLLGGYGAIQVWQFGVSPGEIARMVFGVLGAAGNFSMAYDRRRREMASHPANQVPLAWGRWILPVASVVGVAIGTGFGYWELRDAGLSQEAAAALAVVIAMFSGLVVFVIVRATRKSR